MDDEELNLRSKIQKICRYIVFGNELESKVNDRRDILIMRITMGSLNKLRENYQKMIDEILSYRNVKNKIRSPRFREEDWLYIRISNVKKVHDLEFSEARIAEELKREQGYSDEVVEIILKHPEVVNYGVLDYLKEKYGGLED